MKSYAKRESFRSFIVFGLVGVLNTGIDVAVFSLLTWWQLPWLAAQIAGYGCGVLNSFLMNRKWTFKQRGPFAKGLLRFLLLMCSPLDSRPLACSSCMSCLESRYG
nr:GtrA family protein [Paenibacillus sp. DMB20]